MNSFVDPKLVERTIVKNAKKIIAASSLGSTRSGNKELEHLAKRIAAQPFNSVAAAIELGEALGERIVALSQQQNKQNLDQGTIRQLVLKKQIPLPDQSLVDAAMTRPSKSQISAAGKTQTASAPVSTNAQQAKTRAEIQEKNTPPAAELDNSEAEQIAPVTANIAPSTAKDSSESVELSAVGTEIEQSKAADEAVGEETGEEVTSENLPELSDKQVEQSIVADSDQDAAEESSVLTTANSTTQVLSEKLEENEIGLGNQNQIKDGAGEGIEGRDEPNARKEDSEAEHSSANKNTIFEESEVDSEDSKILVEDGENQTLTDKVDEADEGKNEENEAEVDEDGKEDDDEDEDEENEDEDEEDEQNKIEEDEVKEEEAEEAEETIAM